jgi:ribosomal protein S18 acetylase RimI-like enzyme
MIKQVNLRLMTPSDIPAGMHLKESAGWNQTWEDWERFLSLSPDGCFVAEICDEVVGSVTTITYEDRCAWIGMVLVDPNFRGQGLGTALVTKAIEYLDLRRIPCTKLDATPQGKPLYYKLGFHTESEIERWTLTRGDKAPKRTGNTRISKEPLDLDHIVFGADRSFVLTSFAEQAPEFALVEKADGQLNGYCFGRKGSKADHLGPWVARDSTSARKLLDGFLNQSSRNLLIVDMVKANRWAEPLLVEREFQFSRHLIRMYRGQNLTPGYHEMLCAIAGPEFG